MSEFIEDYPRDGSDYDSTFYPKANTRQKEKTTKKKGATASSYPIMSEVAKWFKDEEAKCNDLHNVQLTSITVNGVEYSRDVSIEAQILAYQLLQEKLKTKANEFKRYLDNEK